MYLEPSSMAPWLAIVVALAIVFTPRVTQLQFLDLNTDRCCHTVSVDDGRLFN